MKALQTIFQRRLISGVLFALCLASAGKIWAADWAKLSAFTSVKTEPSSVHVRFQSREYDLVSINDETTSQLLSFCRDKYGNLWEKRFAEDLVEVLAASGHPMGTDNTVKLVLKDVGNAREVTIGRAPMTKENRRAIMDERLAK